MNGLGTKSGGTGAAGRTERNRRVTAFALSLAMTFNLFPAQAIAEALETEPKEQAPVEQPAEDAAQQEKAAPEAQVEEKQEEVAEEEAPLQIQAEPEQQAELPLVEQSVDNPEAQIGNTKYATLQEALNAAGSGATVTLLTDVTLAAMTNTGFSVASGKRLTLNLNGKRIVSNGNAQVIITNEGDLTITGTGQIYRSNSLGYGNVIANNGSSAKLTIEGGDFGNSASAETATVSINGGTAEIKGGNFTNASSTAQASVFSVSGETASLTIGGTTNVSSKTEHVVSARSGKAEITGGTFVSTNVKNLVYNLSNSKVPVSGGDFDVTFADEGYLFYAVNDKLIEVTGGHFRTSTESLINESFFHQNNQPVVITGGWFSAPIPKKTMLEGYRITRTGDDNFRYTVVTGDGAVAGVDVGDGFPTYYALQAAVDKAASGSSKTVWLAASTGADKTVTVPRGSSVTIRTILDTSNQYATTFARLDCRIEGAITLSDDATLTLDGNVAASGAVTLGTRARLNVGTNGATTASANAEADATKGGKATVWGDVLVGDKATLYVSENGEVRGNVNTDTDGGVYAVKVDAGTNGSGSIMGQVTAKSGTLSVNDGISEAATGTSLINKGSFYYLPVAEGSLTEVNIYGGTYRLTLSGHDELLASGYMPTTIAVGPGTGTYTNSVASGVAATIEENGKVLAENGYFIAASNDDAGITAAVAGAIAAVTDGQTIKLQADCTTQNNMNSNNMEPTNPANFGRILLNVDKSYTLDLNGRKWVAESAQKGVIYSSAGNITIIDSEGDSLIKSGNLQNPRGALTVGVNSTVTVKGGSFWGTGRALRVDDGGSLSIPAESTAEFYGDVNVYAAATAADIQGGYFSDKDSLLGALKGSYGVVEATGHESVVAPGVSTWYTVARSIVQVEGGNRYPTLAEALADIEGTTDKTIALLDNVDEQGIVIPAGTVTTIDLNDHRLKQAIGVDGELTVKDTAATATPKAANVAGVALGTNAKLTVSDEGGLRNVVVDSVTADPGANRTATLENASIVNATSVTSGTLSVNPDESTGLFPAMPTAASGAKLAIAGGLYNAIVAEADRAAGCYPVATMQDMAGDAATLKAYPYTINNDIPNPIATVGGLYYATLDGAVIDASATDTITIVADVTTADGVATIGDVTGARAKDTNKTLTIDLAGHTYTTSGIKVGNANVTVKDSVGGGKLVGDSADAIVVFGGTTDAVAYGSLVVDGTATVEAAIGQNAIAFNASTSTNAFGFDVTVKGIVNGPIAIGALAPATQNNLSTLTIADGATVQNANTTDIIDAITVGGIAAVIVDGGVIASKVGNGISLTAGELYVNGGKIQSAERTSKAGIALNAKAKPIYAVIEGGEVTGFNGIAFTTSDTNATALGIHGGTISSTDSSATADALNVDTGANLKSVDLTGKSIATTDFTPALATIGVVYGGDFNTALANDDAAPDYVPYLKSEGVWSVKSGKNVAAVYTTKGDESTKTLYTDLQEALDAAAKVTNAAGGYVQLLDDVAGTYQAKSGKVTLDINGHELKSAADTLKVEKGATLTLTDAGVTAKAVSTTSATGSAVTNEGTLTIDGVAVSGGLRTVANDGTLTIAQSNASYPTTLTNTVYGGTVLYSGADGAKATVKAGAFDAQGVFGKVFDGASGEISIVAFDKNDGNVNGGTYSDDFTATGVKPEDVKLSITQGYSTVNSTDEEIAGGSLTYKIAQSLKAYELRLRVPFIAAGYKTNGSYTKVDYFFAYDSLTQEKIGMVTDVTALSTSGSLQVEFSGDFSNENKTVDGLTSSFATNGRPFDSGTYTIKVVPKSGSELDGETVATLVVDPYDISESDAFFKTYSDNVGSTGLISKRVGLLDELAVAFDPYAEGGAALPRRDMTLDEPEYGKVLTFKGVNSVSFAPSDMPGYSEDDVDDTSKNTGFICLLDQYDPTTSLAKTVSSISGVYAVSYADNTGVNDKATVTVAGQGNFTGTRDVNFKIDPVNLSVANQESVTDDYGNTTKTNTHVVAALDLSAKGGQPKPIVRYMKEALTADQAKVIADADADGPITADALPEGDYITLAEGTDYSVGYTTSGTTTTVTVTGINNYAGVYRLTYDATDVTTTDIATSEDVTIYLSTSPVTLATDATGLAKNDAIAAALGSATLVWSAGKVDTYQFVANGSEFKPALTVVVRVSDTESRVYSYDPTKASNGLFSEYFTATPTAGKDVQSGIPYALGTNGKDYSGNVSLTWDVVAEKEIVKVAKPVAKTGLTYTGAEQTGVEAGSGYALSGTTKATLAGDYTATASLTDKEGSTWADGTTADVQLTWSIAPAAPKPLDKSELEDAILDATDELLDTVSSRNGKDVSPLDEWATPAAVRELRAAVKAASAAGRKAATQDDVEAALADLETAVSTFEAAKKDGLMTPELDLSGEKLPDGIYSTYESYAHVQGLGDTLPKLASDGTYSFGTVGSSKRVELLQLALDEASLDDLGISGGFKADAHAQTYGWLSQNKDAAKFGNVTEGETVKVGTFGESKRLEAFKLELTGELADYYDVWYCAHIQSYGWLEWTCNGENAGSEGGAKRMEQVDVVILPKGEKPADYGQDTHAGQKKQADAYLYLNSDGSRK